MQKIKNPILCWIVILAVFIRPTPAHAFVPLAAVAVGAAIAATGVMVAGAGVYKPPTFAQANAAVDQVTGDITRKVVVARAFVDGVSAGMKGYQSQYTLDFPKVAEWVRNNVPSYPALYPAVDAAKTILPYTPLPGEVIKYPDGTNHTIVSKYGSQQHYIWYGCPSVEQAYLSYNVDFGGGYRTTTPPGTTVLRLCWNFVDTGSNVEFDYQDWLVSNTTNPPTVRPSTDDPTKFAAAYPNTEAGQDETDRIAAENPAAVKSAPPAFTLDQIKEASAQAMREVLNEQAVSAEAAAAADPTNTALQVAAQQARNAAEQAAVEAEAIKAETETKTEEPEKTDTPPPAGPALDQDLQIDFSPFLGLKDKAMSKFPFSAVSSLGSIFSGLTADPVTPSMDMPMPWGLPSAKISLSKWDDFAAKWRFLIAMMFHASCIYAIVRRYA